MIVNRVAKHQDVDSRKRGKEYCYWCLIMNFLWNFLVSCSSSGTFLFHVYEKSRKHLLLKRYRKYSKQLKAERELKMRKMELEFEERVRGDAEYVWHAIAEVS